MPGSENLLTSDGLVNVPYIAEKGDLHVHT